MKDFLYTPIHLVPIDSINCITLEKEENRITIYLLDGLELYLTGDDYKDKSLEEIYVTIQKELSHS